MAKHTYSSSNDQHDSKEFRESFGSFGTTTAPGANQLTELQTKIRQGVKHVELHLASRGKGNFGQQDVPDKYGFEQRRTIMQLAKMNEQTLSVHASFDVVSFSGLGQGGFNETERAVNIRELDESVKFAAETAKGGAVVFHIQGDPIQSSMGELNVSKEYLEWLEKNNKEEYNKLKKNYMVSNPLRREFVDNIEQEKEAKAAFEKLSSSERLKFEKLGKENGNYGWEEYFTFKNLEKTKVSPDYQPLIVVGDKISGTQRQAELVDFDSIRNLSQTDKDLLKSKFGVDLNSGLNIDGYQRLNAYFTNGKPANIDISDDDFSNLKKKILLDYEDIFEKNNYLQSQADKEFHKKLINNQKEMAKLQKDDFELNFELHRDEFKEIERVKQEEARIAAEINLARENGDTEKLESLKKELKGGIDLSADEQKRLQELIGKKQSNILPEAEKGEFYKLYQKAAGINQYKSFLQMQEIGQLEYQKLERYDELVADINKKIKEFDDQLGEVKSITDETFNKNTTAMAHLGIKALRYQLDMKQKAKDGEAKVASINSEIKKLQDEYDKETDPLEQNKIHTRLAKKRYELKSWVGTKDYGDIDLIDRPLYLAPENMLPGYGSLTSLENYKAVVRMSQQEFAKKILSDEKEYKSLKEEYEKETGVKITSHDQAVELAKRHIGGTFDNAHAAVWLKHFRKEEGESEEHRIDRFNEWLNSQAEEMYREGIIKHVHFNDTQGKDDDHNLIGQGLLDVHDLRERLRNVGLKEALIVEAGGRGANSVMHLQNAWDIFNPSLFADANSEGGTGYKLGKPNQENQFGSGSEVRSANGVVGSSGVSDWMSVSRGYQNRPQYSTYGFGYSSFRHNPPQNGNQRGSWSGTGFF